MSVYVIRMTNIVTTCERGLVLSATFCCAINDSESFVCMLFVYVCCIVV